MPAFRLRVNILNDPIEIRHSFPFTEASGLQSTICAALIFEKIDRTGFWVAPVPFIGRELPDLLEIADKLCNLLPYHFEHAVFVLPAGSAQKSIFGLFNDPNKFHLVDVNIGCIIV